MKRRQFFWAPIAAVGALFGFSRPALAEDRDGDLRVCPKCEAARRDMLLITSGSGASVFCDVDFGKTGEIVFCGDGNVEILRACAHRMWVNPAVKTNKATKEFASHFGSVLDGRGLLVGSFRVWRGLG